MTPKIENILNTLEPFDMIRLGGSGNKCCHIVKSNVDSFIYPSRGMKFWDMCGPESLVKGMGGFATDMY